MSIQEILAAIAVCFAGSGFLMAWGLGRAAGRETPTPTPTALELVVGMPQQQHKVA